MVVLSKATELVSARADPKVLVEREESRSAGNPAPASMPQFILILEAWVTIIIVGVGRRATGTLGV